MDAEVLGDARRRTSVADAVDVVDREAGVGERLADHRRFERPAVELEHARRRGRVGDADDRRGAAQRVHAASFARCCPKKAQMRFHPSFVASTR